MAKPSIHRVGMKLPVVILCALIISTSILAKKGNKCNADMATTYIDCDNKNTTVYAYNKTSGECVQCCGCFGPNRFEGKDKCVNKCVKKN
ncbi:Kunitz/Bovine pancreatic trypsin inhibitor domain protein [Ancylostoma caninum]|uniref:Kunitz/Bovine pancreatic trypsin inhibitor domain protein n=1 Tax=Ancylostoma caninum TaxID=29170 RepID=A0A368F4T2_ANCCA|nr:Kunitz/Bovine pancreatic trypsin inhibitor domain protein [Ancylostoma caninum]